MPFVGGAPIQQGNALEITNTRRYVQQVAAAWAALPANGTTNFTNGVMQLSGTSSGQQIFAVNGSELASASGLQITAPAGATVVVNVDGATNQLANLEIGLNGVDRRHLVFNFPQTTSLTINAADVPGLVWAPDATFSDTLVLVRQQLWPVDVFWISPTNPEVVTIPEALFDRLTDTLAFAA